MSADGPAATAAPSSFPRLLLRLEGLALFAGALALYFHADFSALALALLFLAPDLAMVGYLRGPRVGAVVYDVVHFEGIPVLLAVIGVIADWNVGVQLGLIWLAHIGMDRLAGYGLKYETAFRDTHLQRV